MVCNSCGYDEDNHNADEFIGIFANGIQFLTTDGKICGLFGCPRCQTVQFNTDEDYLEKRKEKYKRSFWRVNHE